MVSFIVRLTFNQEDRADVAETLRLLAAASRTEPGCVSYIPHQLEDDPNTVVIYEQYLDQKALAAHRETEHFKKHVLDDHRNTEGHQQRRKNGRSEGEVEQAALRGICLTKR